MSCRQYRDDISLLAGHDLDDPVREEAARRHMAECPSCRDRYGRVREGMSALTAVASSSAAGGATWTPQEQTCWPQVERRLLGRGGTTSAQSGPDGKSQAWLPAAAMALACLVMVTVFLLDGGGAGTTPTADTMRVVAPPIPSFSAPAHDSRIQSPDGREAMPAANGGLRLDSEEARRAITQ